MSRDDGGPAFPCDVFDPQVKGPEQWEGLSLRDYFAAKAMHAQIAKCTWGIDDDAGDIAQEAYTYADAMLKAREL